MTNVAKGLRTASFRNKYLALTVSMLLFFSGISYAQLTPVPRGLPNQIDQFNGVIQGVRGSILAIVDTLNNPTTPKAGALTVRPQDTLFSTTPPIYMTNGHFWFNIGINAVNRHDTLFAQLPAFFDSTSHPGSTILKILHPNGLISGGIVTLDSCMSVDVQAGSIILNYNQINFAQTIGIVIPASDPTFDRIDAIVVDSTGRVFDSAGIASATPVPPQLNPSSQILLTYINVPHGATCLPITQGIIYDGIADFAGQYNTSTFGTITTDFINTANPFHLNQALFIQVYTDGSGVTFTKPSGYDTATVGEILKLPVYFNGVFSNQLRAQLTKDGSPVTSNLVLNPYFNINDSNQYQISAIPLSAWSFTTRVPVFNGIRFSFGGNDLSGAKGLFFDYIQLQQGLQPQTKNFVDSIGRIGDSAYYYINGNPYFGFALSGGGGGGTQATIYTKDSSLNGDRIVDVATHALTFNNAGSFNVNAVDNGSIGFAVGSASTSLFLFDSTTAGIAHSDANGFSVMEETLTGIEINSPYPIYLGQTHTGTNLSQVHINSGIGNITTDAVLTLNRSTGVVDTVNASSFGGTVLANNGLTKVVDSIQLGGTLTAATTISGNTFTLSVLGSVASPNAQFKVSNSGTGEGVNINSTSGTGLEVVSSSGIGSIITATAGTGLVLGSGSGLPLEVQANPSSTNTVISMASLERFTSGTAANGIGASVDFSLENATSFGVSNQLISKWTDATNATRTSEFSITGVNSASTSTLFTLSGSGALKLNQYASGAFYHNDTTNYKPVIIDASGNIFQGSWAGSGGTVPNFAFNENHTGSTSTTITLAHNYTSGTERVFKNGVRIQIPTDFSESGANTLLLASAPLVSDNFTIDFNY